MTVSSRAVSRLLEETTRPGARDWRRQKALPEKAGHCGGARARRRMGRGAAAALELEDSRRRRRRACVRLTLRAGLEFIVEGPLVPADKKARD